jgi:Gpi16 subunit, GPI transamidase component.
VKNNHPNKNITLAYLDIIPYFVRLYVHTLKVDINGVAVKPGMQITFD